MTKPVVTIGSAMARIEGHALQTYPEECCGFLFGTESPTEFQIFRAQSVSNERAGSRTHRYLVTPDQFLKAEDQAEKWDYQLLGGYHSHPDHPASPSQFDLEHALPGFVYLILSVYEGYLETWRWWMLADDHQQFDELQFTRNYKEK